MFSAATQRSKAKQEAEPQLCFARQQHFLVTSHGYVLSPSEASAMETLNTEERRLGNVGKAGDKRQVAAGKEQRRPVLLRGVSICSR